MADIVTTLARGLMPRRRAHEPGKLKQALMNWVGFGLTDVEHWRQLYGRESAAGERVGVHTAMRLSAVHACVRLISQTISTLPLQLYRVTDEGRERVTTHPSLRLVRQKPNDKMLAAPFWEAVVVSILLQRGAYIEKRMLGGRLIALEFIHPLRITRRPDGDYEIRAKSGQTRPVSAADVIHIPAFTMDGESGMSVIEYGFEVMGGGLAADRAANTTFHKGLLPTVAFKYPATLRENQRADAREAIKLLSGAVNAGEPVILEAGTDAIPIGINPKDAQLIESRQLNAEEICSLFGVPPVMIGRGDKSSSWASSSENLALWFLQYCLRAWMKRIEAALWDGLLTPVEQVDHYFEYSIEGLLRADTKGRTELYASALQNGWMSRNQVARLENMPLIPGGDVYTVQSNLVPIDRLGVASGADTSARNAIRQWLDLEDPK